jgi:valyl-tRNA synthetase
MTVLSCAVQEIVELCCEEHIEADNEENDEEEKAASFPTCSKVMQRLDRSLILSDIPQVPETIIKSLSKLETIQQICLKKVQQTTPDMFKKNAFQTIQDMQDICAVYFIFSLLLGNLFSEI